MTRMMYTLMAAFLAAAVLPATTSAQEQGFRYTTDTEVKLGGTFGRIAAASGVGDMHPVTTSVQGLLHRRDDGDQTTITNAEEGWWAFIDHERRSYFKLTFAEAAQRAKVAAEQLKSRMQERSAGEEQPADSEPDVQMDFDMSFRVDRTGDRRRIADHETERFFLTLGMEAIEKEESRARREAETGEEVDLAGGTLVFFADAWIAEDMAGGEIERAFQEALSQEMGQMYSGTQFESLKTLFEQDPRIRAGIEGAQAEMEEMEGFAMQKTTHMVTLPLGQKFDREAALEAAERGLDDDAADAAMAAAASEAKKTLGGITRGIGLGKKKEEEPKKPEPQQGTVLIITETVTAAEILALPVGTFQLPADYTDRTEEERARIDAALAEKSQG